MNAKEAKEIQMSFIKTYCDEKYNQCIENITKSAKKGLSSCIVYLIEDEKIRSVIQKLESDGFKVIKQVKENMYHRSGDRTVQYLISWE